MGRVAIGHENNMSEKLARSLLITVSAMVEYNWLQENRRRKQALPGKQQRGDSDRNGHFCSHPAAVFERGGDGGELARNQAGQRAGVAGRRGFWGGEPMSFLRTDRAT